MKPLLLTCVFITLTCLSFASATIGGCNCSFTGIVVDATSGKPMAHVVVFVAKGSAITSEQKAETDDLGQFSIPSLPEGKYTLRFQKINYKSVEKRDVVVTKSVSKLTVALTQNDGAQEDHHNWLLKIDLL